MNRSGIVCFLNAAAVLGDEHLAFLSELLDTQVPVDRIAVRPQDSKAVADLPAEVPGADVALLATQYMSPENRLRQGTHARMFGNVISKAMWEKLRKIKAADLEEAALFLRSVLDRYSLEALKGVVSSRSSWFHEVPLVFVRVASSEDVAQRFGEAPQASQAAAHDGGGSTWQWRRDTAGECCGGSCAQGAGQCCGGSCSEGLWMRWQCCGGSCGEGLFCSGRCTHREAV